LSDYVKVVEFCLDSFNEEEVEAVLNVLKIRYLQHRKKKEERGASNEKQIK
jgi:hypothetical protein